MAYRYDFVPHEVLPLTDKRWWTGVRPAAKHHLIKSMVNMTDGMAATPSFHLYGKDDVSLVDDFFAKVAEAGIDVPQWQLDYEMSRKQKWAPQGGHAPWSDLQDSFELYYSRPRWDVRYETALLDKYRALHLTPLPLDSVIPVLAKADKILERAAGWRDFDLKKTNPNAQQQALKDALSGQWMKAKMYTFARRNKMKDRLFFPGPFCLMLLEAQYVHALMVAIQQSLRDEGPNSPFRFMADKIGFEKMFADIVSPLCEGADPSKLVFIQRDFEKMDTTCGFKQTRASYVPRIAAAFGVREGSSEYKHLLTMAYIGSTMPVITPSGVHIGSRGKASGLNSTNMDETFCNEDYDRTFTSLLLQKCEEKGLKFRVLASFGNGDDGHTIGELDQPERLDDFRAVAAEAADEAAEIHGFRVQGSKWTIDIGHGVYCQRMDAPRDGKIWHAYPATLILNSIVHPEHQYAKADWDKDYRDLDVIEKLDNGAGLQYFHLLVDYVDKGMKYRLLGRDEKSLMRILSKWERYRQLRQDHFNWEKDEEDRRNITTSPTIQYLLEKRSWHL